MGGSASRGPEHEVELEPQASTSSTSVSKAGLDGDRTPIGRSGPVAPDASTELGLGQACPEPGVANEHSARHEFESNLAVGCPSCVIDMLRH